METSADKAQFYIDVDDPENDPIEIQWKMDDKEEWSSLSENVITMDELTSGEHTIHVKAKEKDGGKKGSEERREFTIPENQPPVFVIDELEYPAPNIVRFHFTGEDPEGDTFEYIYEVKDKGGKIIRSEESVNGPMNIVFLSLPSGTYTTVVKAKDDKGKESKPKESDEFVIENRGPVAKISKQEDQLTFSATDHEGDIVSQFIYKINDKISDEEGNNIPTKKVSADGSEAVVPINKLPPGTYKISVQAEDDKGNRGDPVERRFTIENRGPVVTISEPLYGDGSVEFRLSAVDHEKDAIVAIILRAVDSVGKSYLINLGLQQFKAGKGEHIIITPGEYSRLEQIKDGKSNTGKITSSLPPGDYRLFARAKDDKGNMGKAKEREFKISEPVSLSISRGEVAPLGKDIGDHYSVGWGYEISAVRHFTPSWSSSISLGFQKFYQEDRSLQIIPLYVRGTYLLLKTSNRRFQLKPFFGLGINFYKFDPSQTYGAQPYDYDNATAWGPEMGLIMDFAILPPTSPNNISFILQGGANYTYHSDFQSVFTSLMLGMKYKF